MSNLVEVSVPMPSAAAAERAQAYLTNARAVVILNPDDYERAAADLKAIKGKWREIEETRKSLKKPIDEAAARIQSFFSAPLGFLTQAEIIIKQKLVAYSDEQDRIRAEEQRRANEAAEKERRRQQEIADRARAKGHDSKADLHEERAQSVVAAVSETAAPRVSGVSIPRVWAFEITDSDLIPREYLIVDETKIRRVVTALKGDTKIPGVRVFEQKRVSAGVA